MPEDRLEQILEEAADEEMRGERAPSRLKSRIYSALMRQQAEEGPLLSLPATRAAGRGLCIFESLTSASPVGEPIKQLNLCRVCHARHLAERVERAPIYWAHCPYVAFQNQE